MNALQILQAINLEFPGAVIAGGYVRDKLFGNEPKDIDVYIYTGGNFISNDVIEASLRSALGPCDEALSMMLESSAESSDNDFNEHLEGVYKHVPRSGGLSVDVLFFNEPVAPDASNVLNSFDVALCQAAMLPNGNIVMTPGCVLDFNGATLTILRPTQHAERLAEKFRARTVVGPRWTPPTFDEL